MCLSLRLIQKMTACVQTFDQSHDTINDIFAEGAVEGYTQEMNTSSINLIGLGT